MQLNRQNIIIAIVAVLLLALSATTVAAQTETPAEVDWFAQYWNDVNLSGTPAVTRTEAHIDHIWGQGSPDPAISPDRFSARWTTSVELEGGNYRFTTVSDDGVRVWVDGVRIIDNWTVHPETTNTAAIPLSAGTHDVTVEYFENTGLARMLLSWQRLADPEEEQVTISPMSGPPGTVLTVTAQGFTPNSEVTVGIGRAQSEPTTSQTVTTDAAGSLETQITVPLSAEPGEPWVVLVISPDSAERALSGTFTVTGQPATDCGDTYTVRPGDWMSRIARQCGTTVEAILAVNPGITNPDIIYSGQVLEMPGADTPAQVSIAPDQGPVGTVIQVNAVGFDPNTQVTVGIGRANSEPTTSRTVMTGPPGAVETTIALPPDAGVGEPWVVLVSSGEESALSETFTVTGADVTATTRFNLNFRPLPTVASQPMDVIPGGTTVPVVGRDENNSWLLVIYEGRRGWVAGWLTNIQGNLANVPVEQP